MGSGLTFVCVCEVSCSCARRRAGPPGAGAGAWGVISYQSKQQNVCRRSVGLLQTPVRACAGIYFVVNSRCLRSVITPPTYTPTRPCSTSPASRIPEGREATGVTHAVAARGSLRRAPVSSAHFAIGRSGIASHCPSLGRPIFRWSRRRSQRGRGTLGCHGPWLGDTVH